MVERIGDILLDVVPQFAPFVSYGSHQLYGKFEFEKEKSANPAFQKFVDVSGVAVDLEYLTLISARTGNRTAPRIAEAGAQWLSNETNDASCAISIVTGRCLEVYP